MIQEVIADAIIVIGQARKETARAMAYEQIIEDGVLHPNPIMGVFYLKKYFLHGKPKYVRLTIEAFNEYPGGDAKDDEDEM